MRLKRKCSSFPAQCVANGDVVFDIEGGEAGFWDTLDNLGNELLGEAGGSAMGVVLGAAWGIQSAAVENAFDVAASGVARH
ncbi:MAG: hypothetical protein LBE15_06290 [Burkholderiales bacterium]|jgi:hypothetical protein|nr:hypothetical protein [Burkholderiales bacterium]